MYVRISVFSGANQMHDGVSDGCIGCCRQQLLFYTTLTNIEWDSSDVNDRLQGRILRDGQPPFQFDYDSRPEKAVETTHQFWKMLQTDS